MTGKDNINKYARTAEAVDGPAHYGGKNNVYETVKVIEAWGLDKDYFLGNVVKYISRAGKKDPGKLIEDLKKAQWYLNRRIENLELSEIPSVGCSLLPPGTHDPRD